jgi:hypothetical protein
LVEFQALVDAGDVLFSVFSPKATPILGGDTPDGTAQILTWIRTKTVVQQTQTYRVYRLD